MRDDPLEPISFERAVNELWEQLGAHAGLKGRLRGSVESLTEITDQRGREMDEELARLHDDAFANVFVLISSERVSVWIEDSDAWKHPMPRELHDRLVFDAVDEPKGLYVDRQQLRAAAADVWPDKYETRAALASVAPSEDASSQNATNRKVGRPKGPGYALKDAGLFEMIWEAQRQSGYVETKHGLIKKFAPREPSYDTNVDRLRRGLPKWLGQNGYKWNGSD
jgi:hypothetical protein